MINTQITMESRPSTLVTSDGVNDTEPGMAKEMKFLFLALKKEVSGFNVSSFYLIQFAAAIVTSFMNTFLSYIVKSPEYYNIPRDHTASVVGTLAFYSELVIIPFHLLLGSLMDVMGRKIPTVTGLLTCGAAIIGIPFGTDIYPDLCIMRYAETITLILCNIGY